MNIKEKEAYIEYLKDTLEGIKYPENPFSKYIILKEYYEDCSGSVSSISEYNERVDRAFRIGQRLSTDIME